MIKVTYTSKIPQVKAQIKQAAIDAAAKNAYEVLKIAETLVPLDKGPLQNSGRVIISSNAVYVSYGFGRSRRYAVDQHENLMYRHLPGRQAKYLEQPFRAQVQKTLQDIIDAVKDSL